MSTGLGGLHRMGLSISAAAATIADGVVNVAPRSGPCIRVAAVGDLDFAGDTYLSLMRAGPEHVFREVKPILARSDTTVANLESVLVAHPYTRLGRQAYLVSDLSAVAAMRDAGIGVATMANNHIMDAGSEGLAECVHALCQAGICATGAGRDRAAARVPARMEIHGLQLRFHAYTYDMGELAGDERAGCLEASLPEILADLAEFHRPGDIVFVSLHLDAEFRPAPSPARIELCRALAGHGVHAILCHHPHVVQGIEVHQGSLIAYGLGNFVTPIAGYLVQPSDDTHLSLVLEMEVDEEGVRGARMEPVVIDAEGRPVPADSSERKQILSLLAERSAMLARPGEITALYRSMVREFGRGLLKDTYWALGERDWARARDNLRMATQPVKREWMRDWLLGAFSRGS